MMGNVDLSNYVEGLFLAVSSVWALYVIADSLTFEALLPAILPLASVGLLLVFIAIRVYVIVRAGDVYDIAEDDAKTYETGASTRQVLLCLGLIVSYAVLALTIGFFWAMPVFLLGFFIVYDLYSGLRLVTVVLLLWVGTSVLFGVVFNISSVDLGPFSAISFELF